MWRSRGDFTRACTCRLIGGGDGSDNNNSVLHSCGGPCPVLAEKVGGGAYAGSGCCAVTGKVADREAHRDLPSGRMPTMSPTATESLVRKRDHLGRKFNDPFVNTGRQYGRCGHPYPPERTVVGSVLIQLLGFGVLVLVIGIAMASVAFAGAHFVGLLVHVIGIAVALVAFAWAHVIEALVGILLLTLLWARYR